ncbi:carbohydrate ABC transporter permease [Paenibacillus sp. PAMC21692]|uniref:carbohydrate ABC transporter permease n=1 Tax=Paenibacillus sp. PAMC21692 TaxID=2762320 RepID=UPI00164ECD22|nr:sugar ABC transporter permease [Paenibacillus sp. PAMC21692]QNK54962.1 sugar ABC transporter permease [Paenibacillus sp. PAMC21692]
MSRILNKKAIPRETLVSGGGSAPDNVQSTRLQKWMRRHKEGIIGYSILSPMILYFSIFAVFPALFVIYLSLTEWTGVTGLPEWVGIKNFRTFFTQGDYVETLIRAGVYGLIILFCSLIIGLLIALLLNQKVFGSGAIRTIWYLPVLVPFAVVAQMVNTLLSPVDGVVKQMMVRFGMEPIVFQESALWMSFWLIIITVWKGVGSTVIIYLAGLQGIDTTLYEAGKVDGASRLKIFWYITIPCLRPITMFLLITGIIGSFQIFEPVQLITYGGPHGDTNIILYRIYQDAFQAFNFGMASASSVVVLVVTLILSVMQYRISQRRMT